MDDDNYAKREEITTFVNVAAFTGADVLTCVNDYFFGNDPPPYGLTPTGRWVPIGDAKTVGMFQNMYGDTNAMIRKSAFDEVGGFPDDYGYALEDWELFSKSVLSGFRLVTIPLPLYWYRLRVTSHSRTTAKIGNQVRTIRPYLDTIPTSLHQLVLFAQGMKESHDKNNAMLEKERYTAFELQKVVKAMSSSLQVSVLGAETLPRRPSPHYLTLSLFLFPAQKNEMTDPLPGGADSTEGPEPLEECPVCVHRPHGLPKRRLEGIHGWVRCGLWRRQEGRHLH